MNEEIDYDLTPEQWETLKALRVPGSNAALPKRLVLQDLVALGLATICDDVPAMTPAGRKTLIRGSSKLWDVAA